MIIDFDVKRGSVKFGSIVTVTGETLVSDLKSSDVKFIRESTPLNGGTLRVAAPLLIDGHRLDWSFTFHVEKLQWVLFSIDAEREFDALKLRESHNRLLERLLGPPTEIKASAVVYRYPWGRIASSTDPHNQNSHMSIGWSA